MKQNIVYYTIGLLENQGLDINVTPNIIMKIPKTSYFTQQRFIQMLLNNKNNN